MKEFNSILEMLIESRTQLLEAKARLKEREAEIDKDLSDCYIAIAALTPKVEVAAEQPQEPTERLPQKGDNLVAIKNVHNDNGDIVIQVGKTYPVDRAMLGAISVVDDKQQVQMFFTGGGKTWNWKKFFRFADELTSEDQSNLHSYLHVNGEAKKPYRIKTRQEMIDGGAVEFEGFLIHQEASDIAWINGMDYLQSRGLETNERQEIDGFNIDPWMITENK